MCRFVVGSLAMLMASAAIAGECSDAKNKERQAAESYNAMLFECEGKKEVPLCKKRIQKAWDKYTEKKAKAMIACDLYPEGDEV